MSRSLFERFALDPRVGLDALTERLREMAEEATDPDARAEIRAAWEALTLHPMRRLEEALDTHPGSTDDDASPAARLSMPTDDRALALSDLVGPASIADALGPPSPEELAVIGPPIATLGARSSVRRP